MDQTDEKSLMTERGDVKPKRSRRGELEPGDRRRLCTSLITCLSDLDVSTRMSDLSRCPCKSQRVTDLQIAFHRLTLRDRRSQVKCDERPELCEVCEKKARVCRWVERRERRESLGS